MLPPGNLSNYQPITYMSNQDYINSHLTESKVK